MNRFCSVAAGLFGACALTLSFSASAESIFIEGAPALKEEAAETKAALPSFSNLVKELSPAVVNISVESDSEAQAQAQDESAPQAPQAPVPPFLKREPGTLARSLGSGFILTTDGYIVTNNHVIDKSTKIIVRLLNDKAEYEAKIIGVDPKTDLALIKIEAKKALKVAYFGDSDRLEVGEWVIAIGNQFQLGQTVTAGIVSATSRRVPTSSPYDAFIQTDASINPGSSGGPLFNTKGQVVGINTAIFSPGRAQFGGAGFNIGIGFAIPINLVKGILTQIKEQGKVTRGLLGVMIQKIDAEMAEALGLPTPTGALVSDVMPETPASKAGVKRRDIITSFNGHLVNDHDELPLMVANTPIGTTVKIEVLRDGISKTLTTVITELKDSAKKGAEGEAPKVADQLGLLTSEVPQEIAKAYKMEGPTGVIVEALEPGSAGERAGLTRGDIILELGGQPIKDAQTYAQILKSLQKGKPTLALVRRAEGTRYLVIKAR